MNIVMLIVMTVLIILLLGIYLRLSKSPADVPDQDRIQEALEPAGSGKRSPCPLCGSLLKPGERVKSVVYPGKGDRLVEIYGCPYCYPPNSGYTRSCPSCKRPLNQDELVFARLFESSGKVHVHVNGCRICMRRQG